MSQNRSTYDEREKIRAEENALIDFQFAIIEALDAKGLSYIEFAELLGVSKARVSQLLASDANPTLKLVGRICSVLSLDIVFSGEGARASEKAFGDFGSLLEGLEQHDVGEEDWQPSSAIEFIISKSGSSAVNDNFAKLLSRKARKAA